MYTPPSSFSRSIIGKGRLLCLVLASGDALRARMDEPDNVASRLTVWFPNPDEQWPTDDDGNRIEIDPISVARDEVPHARLMLDGEKVSRKLALDTYRAAEQEAAAADDALNRQPFYRDNGEPYYYETGREVPSKIKDDDGNPVMIPEVKAHSHKSLRDDLAAQIRGYGLNPIQVAKDQGYRPVKRG